MTTAITVLALPLRAGGSRLERMRQYRLYDALMRLPVLAWGAALVLVSLARLRDWVDTADPALTPFTYGINLAMHLSTIAFCAMIVGAVLLRMRPAARARGLEPRLSALCGSFLATAVVFFPRHELPLPAELASVLLVATGYTLASLALFRLGRSFSIMPEARRLVTSGMYGLVRHPLYLAEELATIGILLQFLSGWTVLLCVAHIAFQLRRIHHEEELLAAIFPEYPAYSARTARLFPGIY